MDYEDVLRRELDSLEDRDMDHEEVHNSPQIEQDPVFAFPSTSLSLLVSFHYVCV